MDCVLSILLEQKPKEESQCTKLNCDRHLGCVLQTDDVQIPILRVLVLSRAFGKWLNQESRALTNGICAIIKDSEAPLPLPLCENTGKASETVPMTDTKYVSALIFTSHLQNHEKQVSVVLQSKWTNYYWFMMCYNQSRRWSSCHSFLYY